MVTATVRGVTNYGAFVEVEEGIDGMIHISDLSWTRKYSHPNEALQKGDQVKCVVLDIDPDKQRVSLGVKQLSEDPWVHAIPEKYIPGHIVRGKVTKLTNFGAFVQLEQDLEGLLHISELSDQKITRPQDVVKVDDELEVKILKVDSEARKIGLSLRRAQWAAEEHGGEPAPEADSTPDNDIPPANELPPANEMLGQGGQASSPQPQGAEATTPAATEEQMATDEPSLPEPTSQEPGSTSEEQPQA
jgi:small subunit ribosomal protein S1